MKNMSSHEKPKKLKLQHESNDNSLITKTRTPCILIFDSAPGIIPINVGNMIVEYLYWEYKLKKNSTIKLSDFDVKCVYPEHLNNTMLMIAVFTLCHMLEVFFL
ncbi:hypothetical protein TSAR_003564 [Trichomalopsis sarcophagae]|uniref:Uncharacterized protein n=1 Tax=Trichomalopsis sarcophagae TaxID=543379 RepID=A0A232FDE4_9HYME|nr:hypothetical protein TSAR_003564 [Trichomalopsis sarcophagae]